MPVKREINQQQYRADCAAFPETNRNNALAGPFRCDPLNKEAGTENEVAAPAKNFPAIDRHSSDRCIGNQMKTVHGATLAENACPRESFPANILVYAAPVESICDPPNLQLADLAVVQP